MLATPSMVLKLLGKRSRLHLQDTLSQPTKASPQFSGVGKMTWGRAGDCVSTRKQAHAS